MTDYTVEPTYQYFNELIETKTPIVPMLSYVRVKKNGSIVNELNIVYYNPKKHALDRIYSSDFEVFMFKTLSSFEQGMSSRVLAGIVRSSKPGVAEKWHGDTIEKINYESFSLYRGILSITGENDGLPLVVPQNSAVVGDIVPGIKRMLNGKNPTIVRQEIKQFETLQNRIADIIGDNPFKTAPDIAIQTQSGVNENLQGLSDKQIARLAKRGQL